MTGLILANAIGNISDRYILDGLYGISKKNKTKHSVWVKLLAACLACTVCTVIIAVLLQNSFFPHGKDTEYYGIIITDTIADGVHMSRTGSISPFTPECEEKVMTNKDLRRFFQCADYNLFEEQTSNYTVIFNGDKTVHTVRMIWYFDDGYVCAIFDPRNYPEFLFNNNSETQVNGYHIVAQKSLTEDANTEIDIGMKKNDMGIWLFGNTACKDKMEIIINYILNSEISFDLR